MIKVLPAQEILSKYFAKIPVRQAADASYALPDYNWLIHTFRWKFGKFMQENFGPWTPRGDCDDYAFAYKLAVQKFHRDGPAPDVVDGCAVGVVFFMQDNGGGHAINWALTDKGNGVELIHIEPQSGGEICLSQQELASRWFVYL